MNADACSHRVPFSDRCSECERAQWSLEQIAEAVNSVERGMKSPTLGFTPLDEDDLRVLVDCGRQVFDLQARLEAVNKARDYAVMRMEIAETDASNRLTQVMQRSDELAAAKCELARLVAEASQQRSRSIDEAISVCELNMPYDSMGLSATIRILFRRFTEELHKLKAAGSVERYIECPSAGEYEPPRG